MIDGVVLTPLKQIFDERGKVMHMMREDSPTFSRFGEIWAAGVCELNNIPSHIPPRHKPASQSGPIAPKLKAR